MKLSSIQRQPSGNSGAGQSAIRPQWGSASGHQTRASEPMSLMKADSFVIAGGDSGIMPLQ